MPSRRPRGVPLIRIGLTLVVGAALASIIMFYVSVGASMADMRGVDVSTGAGDLASNFTRNFLFAGAIPGTILALGLAIMLIGILRRLRTGPESGT